MSFVDMDEEDTVGMVDEPGRQRRQGESMVATIQEQQQQQAPVQQQGYASQSVQQVQQQQQQHGLGGLPRPALAYRVQTSICEKRDDGPGPRCRHTLTAVAAV